MICYVFKSFRKKGGVSRFMLLGDLHADFHCLMWSSYQRNFFLWFILLLTSPLPFIFSRELKQSLWLCLNLNKILKTETWMLKSNRYLKKDVQIHSKACARLSMHHFYFLLDAKLTCSFTKWLIRDNPCLSKGVWYWRKMIYTIFLIFLRNMNIQFYE